jgi:hypothetical protein
LICSVHQTVIWNWKSLDRHLKDKKHSPTLEESDIPFAFKSLDISFNFSHMSHLPLKYVKIESGHECRLCLESKISYYTTRLLSTKTHKVEVHQNSIDEIFETCKLQKISHSPLVYMKIFEEVLEIETDNVVHRVYDASSINAFLFPDFEMLQDPAISLASILGWDTTGYDVEIFTLLNNELDPDFIRYLGIVRDYMYSYGNVDISHRQQVMRW